LAQVTPINESWKEISNLTSIAYHIRN